MHHMEVFHCEVESNEIIRYYSGPGQAEGKPPELAACRKVIGAWAMGAAVCFLRCLIHCVDFWQCVSREATFVTSCLHSCTHTDPFLQRILL